MKPNTGIITIISSIALAIVWLLSGNIEPEKELVNSAAVEANIKDNHNSNTTEVISFEGADPANHPRPTVKIESAKIDGSEATTGESEGEEYGVVTEAANVLIQDSIQSLGIKDGLSRHNVMILQDLATRLIDLKLEYGTDVPWQTFTLEWPSDLRSALQTLVAAKEAERELFSSWQKQIWQNPLGYREALLKQQEQILSPKLFEALFDEDRMVHDKDGLNANYSDTEDIKDIDSNLHQQRLKLLEQWQANQLSETELTEALSDSLSSQEIEQLVDMGTQHEQWLAQLGDFLNEYRYIEQSGISGEDEAQARQELIERHFTDENRQVVDQFLFGAQASL